MNEIKIAEYESALRKHFGELCADRELQKLNSKRCTQLCFSATEWGGDFAETHNRIMFLGKANNGASVYDELNVEKLFKKGSSVFSVEDGMHWIDRQWDTPNEYGGWRPGKSQFFRVMRSVAEAFYEHDEWYRHIAYGNFCKCNVNNNTSPDWRVYGGRTELLTRLLETDLKYLNPKFIVCFTGSGDVGAKHETLWFSKMFLDNLKQPARLVKTIPWSQYQLLVYESGTRYFLVTEHPMGKSERSHVEAIVNAIQDYSL